MAKVPCRKQRATKSPARRWFGGSLASGAKENRAFVIQLSDGCYLAFTLCWCFLFQLFLLRNDYIIWKPCLYVIERYSHLTMLVYNNNKLCIAFVVVSMHFTEKSPNFWCQHTTKKPWFTLNYSATRYLKTCKESAMKNNIIYDSTSSQEFWLPSPKSTWANSIK